MNYDEVDDFLGMVWVNVAKGWVFAQTHECYSVLLNDSSVANGELENSEWRAGLSHVKVLGYWPPEYFQ